MQSQSTTNPCSVSQAAAVAALDGDQSGIADMVAAYRRRHDFIVDALNDIPGCECRPGEGTFYAFPKVSGIIGERGLSGDAELAEYLLNAADVAVVPGSAFGAAGHIRLSFACSMDALEESMRRLKRAVSA